MIKTRLMHVCVVVMVLLWGLVAVAQERGQKEDRRRVFDPAAMRGLRFEVASRGPLEGFGKPLELLALTRAIPEGQDKGLGAVSRIVILDGNRVEFDSFSWDKVGDMVEPGVDTRTFFSARVSVMKAAKGKTAYLVIAGLMPQQDIGQTARSVNRVLVLSYTPETGFDEVVDAKSSRPAAVTVGSVKIDF